MKREDEAGKFNLDLLADRFEIRSAVHRAALGAIAAKLDIDFELVKANAEKIVGDNPPTVIKRWKEDISEEVEKIRELARG